MSRSGNEVNTGAMVSRCGNLNVAKNTGWRKVADTQNVVTG